MKYGIDQIGDIAILNFHSYYPLIFKKIVAWRLLQDGKVNVVLEKKGIISGELRKTTLKPLAGEKRTDTMHNENGCKFYMDVAETYFSPRLSNERRMMCEEISKNLKNGQTILVMFAGVAPFPIVLARMLKVKGKKAKIISSELNKLASEYAEKNVRLNKLENYVKVIEGDSRKLREGKFDVILMPRPNLEETFLDAALKFSKKGTKIYYHGFGTEEKVLEEIKKDAGKKIGKIKIRKAGDIAPRKWRWLAEFSVN
jgi:tRNA (guanine37-N1)-methyltransferase